jgi:alkylation response protein AidB-like acyl-CoA dehydrogenase
MPYHLTSDQELIRKTVREMAEEIRGKPAEHVDRERAWPAEHLRKLAGLGLTTMLVPADKGGAGADTVSFALAIEEVARASGTVALVLNNLNAFGTFPLALRASPDVLAEALPALASGEKVVAWAMTEPNAGSDAAAMQTRATFSDDSLRSSSQKLDQKTADGTYRLDGLKSFVVGAPQASWFIVMARTGKDSITPFLVPADAPGVKVAPREASMTMRGADMAQVFLHGVKVPASHRLGEEGSGLALAQQCGDVAAVGGAALAVGLMQAAVEDAVQYSGDREQFRMPIKRFQAIQFLVAEMELQLRAARLLTYAAADKRDRGEDFATDAAAAKLYAAESAKFVTQKSIRIHGGTGFMRDLPVERYNRDARALAVYAGTSEAERAAIAAKALGL